MRHYQEHYIMYDEKTGQMLHEYNWDANPVCAASADDVLEDAIRQFMKDGELTENNSTLVYNMLNSQRQHRKAARIYFWHGDLEGTVMEEIIVDEVIIWDDLDLDELDPKARELYETWDWCGSDDPLLECNNIEELNETLLVYGGSYDD